MESNETKYKKDKKDVGDVVLIGRNNNIKPSAFGFSAWTTFFTIAESVPMSIEEECDFAQRMAWLIPCSICQRHYRGHLERYDVCFVIQQKGLLGWLTKVRQSVQRSQHQYLKTVVVQSNQAIQTHFKSLHLSERKEYMECFLHCLLLVYHGDQTQQIQKDTIVWLIQTYMHRWFPHLKGWKPSSSSSLYGDLLYLYKSVEERVWDKQECILNREAIQVPFTALKQSIRQPSTTRWIEKPGLIPWKV